MSTGDTPDVSTPAVTAPTPAAPAATPAPAPTPTETASGSGTPAPVTPTTFADGFAQAEAKLKAEAEAKKVERAAKKAEAAALKPSVEPTTMPATTDEPADDTDDTPGAEARADESETDETPPPPVKKPDGPVPLDRHKKAVENARAKGADEVLAEVTKHYPWVGQVDPREIEQALAIREAVRRNPAAVAQRLLARRGGAPPAGAAPETADVMPDPDLQTEDGKHKMYSEGAHKRSLALLARRLGESFQAELEPLKAFVAEQQTVAHRSQAERIVTDRVESLLKLPGAADHLEEIVTLMERDGRLSDIGAYNRVVPPLLAEENARLRAEKAEAETRFKAGAGSMNPAGASTGSTGKRAYPATTEGFTRAFNAQR